jgi:hypothetical protein
VHALSNPGSGRSVDQKESRNEDDNRSGTYNFKVSEPPSLLTLLTGAFAVTLVVAIGNRG